MSLTHHRFVIAVHNLERSAKFYQDVLGFEIHRIEDPGWLFAKKDACLLMMGECRDAMDPHDLGDHSYFAYLEVDDIDDYHQRIVDAGGAPKYPPQDKPWGMREFPIETVDGHRIMIGQAIE